MYVSNITTIDYDNSTKDYDKLTDICIDNENNADIIIPTLLLTIPCVLSFLCLMSLMVHTLIKYLIKH